VPCRSCFMITNAQARTAVVQSRPVQSTSGVLVCNRNETPPGPPVMGSHVHGTVSRVDPLDPFHLDHSGRNSLV
jgi:hypothetical protein